MNEPMSAAQAAQQNNRGPGGRYSHGTHAEPAGVELSTPAQLIVEDSVPEEIVAAFQGRTGRLDRHPMNPEVVRWSSKGGSALLQKTSGGLFRALASYKSGTAAELDESPSTAADLALQQASLRSSLEDTGFANSSVTVSRAEVKDNLAVVVFEIEDAETLMTYRIEGDIAQGEYEVTASSEQSFGNYEGPLYTSESIMDRATNGEERNLNGFMTRALDDFSQDGHAGMVLADQINPPVEAMLDPSRSDSEAWSNLAYLSENSRLHDASAFNPRSLALTELGRERTSRLLEESRAEIEEYPLRTPNDRRNHLRNLMEQARQ